MFKKLCCILCCIAILCLTATTGFAEGWYWYDGEPKNGSISFDFNNEEISVSGGSLELRQVTYVDLEAKSLRYCEGWEGCGLELDNILSDRSADYLFVYAEINALPAQEIQVGADGKARAEELPMGVYLISQKTAFDGCMPLLPALISIPLRGDDRTWIFDVEAMPKLALEVPETTVPETTAPSTTEPDIPDIPRTGQINWPIPILLLAGSLLIILGVCIRKGQRDET